MTITNHIDTPRKTLPKPTNTSEAGKEPVVNGISEKEKASLLALQELIRRRLAPY